MHSCPECREICYCTGGDEGSGPCQHYRDCRSGRAAEEDATIQALRDGTLSADDDEEDDFECQA